MAALVSAGSREQPAKAAANAAAAGKSRSGRTRALIGLPYTTPVDGALLIDPVEFPEYERGRAEAGEHGLDQVHPDKASKQQPPRADLPGQEGAKEGDAAGEQADKGFGFHVGRKVALDLNMSIYSYT